MGNNVKQYKLTLNRKHVQEIFKNIDGYHEKEIVDLEKLIQGMMFIAENKIGGQTETMFDIFIENLIVAAVEKGSVAVRN